jgi:probable rRNA maturation factor
MILFFEEDISYKLKEKNRIKKWVTEVCKKYNKKVGEINYIFCSDEYLLNINKEYLQHDFYTDIITFDQSENDTQIDGELYISIDRIKDNAATLETTFEIELRRVLIHGILHLIGFGDKSEKEETEMRRLENEHLAQFDAV